MPESSHQVAVLVDANAGLTSQDFRNRVNRLLESLNRPDTMKANVYMIGGDQVVKIVPPKQAIGWGNLALSAGEFDPNSSKVATTLKMYSHNTVLIMTPTGKAKSKVVIPTPEQKLNVPIVAVDPDLKKLLAEEELIEKHKPNYNVSVTEDDTWNEAAVLSNPTPFPLMSDKFYKNKMFKEGYANNQYEQYTTEPGWAMVANPSVTQPLIIPGDPQASWQAIQTGAKLYTDTGCKSQYVTKIASGWNFLNYSGKEALDQLLNAVSTWLAPFVDKQPHAIRTQFKRAVYARMKNGPGYLATISEPDIAAAVVLLSSYNLLVGKQQ